MLTKEEIQKQIVEYEDKTGICFSCGKSTDICTGYFVFNRRIAESKSKHCICTSENQCDESINFAPINNCPKCGNSTFGWCKCFSSNFTSIPDFEYAPQNTIDELSFRDQLKKILISFGNEYNFTPSEEELQETPRRLHQMYAELLKGYVENPELILSKTFDKNHNSIVAVQDIDFVSLCQHHWMPFQGVVHFGYLPANGKVVGLSKIPRLVQCFARRFQSQEQMTQQIVDAFMEHIQPQGCIAISKAEHLCYEIRGPKSKGITTVSEVRGCFESNPDIKHEFMEMIK